MKTTMDLAQKVKINHASGLTKRHTGTAKKTVLFMAAALLMVFLACLPTAASQPTNPITWVCVHYSSGIKPAQGDTFRLYYYNESDGDVRTYDVDAYALSKNHKEEPGFTEGTYGIQKIEYHGTNQAILEQGYGVVDNFYVKDGYDPQIDVVIGTEMISKYQADYGSNLLVSDDSHDASGEPTTPEALAEMQEEMESSRAVVMGETGIQADTELEAGQESGENSDLYGTEEQTPLDGEEPQVEYYGQEDGGNTTGKSLAVKGIVILCVFAVGMAIIYILYKKGKIRK